MIIINRSKKNARIRKINLEKSRKKKHLINDARKINSIKTT